MALSSGNLPHAEIDSVARNDFNDAMAQLDAAFPVETDNIKDANVTDEKLDKLNKGRFENALLHVQDQKASGSSGGTSAARTWNIRDLNAVLTNEIPGASLDSNQITLPAGTYFITASAPCNRVDYHKLKLYNVTDSSDILIGTADYITSSYDIVTRSVVTGRFTLAAQKTLELRHYTHGAKVDNGLGIATGVGVVEVYSDVMIWMI